MSLWSIMTWWIRTGRRHIKINNFWGRIIFTCDTQTSGSIISILFFYFSFQCIYFLSFSYVLSLCIFLNFMYRYIQLMKVILKKWKMRHCGKLLNIQFIYLPSFLIAPIWTYKNLHQHCVNIQNGILQVIYILCMKVIRIYFVMRTPSPKS